jgi:hypothetical protein
MYTINSVALADEINAMHTYYKIKLRKFEDSQSTIDTPEIEQELDNLVTSMDDVFAEKTKDEYLKVTKPQEYKTIGQGNNDYIRSLINNDVQIGEEKINNNWTIVSKNYYALSKMINNVIAIKYREPSKLTSAEDRAFTFWFRSKMKQQKIRLNVTAFSSNSGLLEITTANQHAYAVDDFIEITGHSDYDNNIYRVVSVINNNTFVIDTTYITSSVPTPFVTKVRVKEKAAVLYGYNTTNPTNNGMSIDLYEGYVVVTINGTRYSFPTGVETYQTDIWYTVVVNLSNKFKQLSLYLYKLDKSQTYTMPQNEDSSLTLVKYDLRTLNGPVEFNSNDVWSLLGSSIDLTNIRIFKTPIEEEAHNATLNNM